MEFNIFNESTIWRSARKKRTISFLRILAYITIVIAGQWAVITIIQKIYFLTYVTIVVIGLGFLTLWLIRKNRILFSKILVLITGTGYYLIATIFASGYGINGGTAHFGFIILGLVSYFLLYDLKGYRIVIPALQLILFYAFHFGYAPFYPLVAVPADKLIIIHRMDVFCTIAMIFFVTRQFVIEITNSETALAITADRLEGLIANMLPASVADRMRKEGRTFADEYHHCSILIADIAGFTEWSEHHSANEVVDELNTIFSAFDDAVERMKLTKIKTSGDSYMVAAGIPEYMPDHAIVMTKLALELQTISARYDKFKFRIGVNSGSLVAGVIGKKIFAYDIWGDTVNTTSRLESNGEAGKVNISGTTFELVKDHFKCVYRGKVPAKNKGEIDMYFIE